MTIDLDVLIFGGGVAGLWTLDELRRRGFRVLLLESEALGHGQTVAAQGIIHGGLKYSLKGAVSASARGVSAMPDRWRRHQGGKAEPDLSAMPLRADWCCLWRTGSLRSRAGMLGARAGLRVRPRALDPAEYPAMLRGGAGGGAGTVYRLDEPVIDPVRFLEVMRERNRGHLLQVDGDRGMELDVHEGGGVEAVRLRHPETDDELRLRPSRVVLTAGAGNASLRQRMGLGREGENEAMQRRPLHMTMVRGERGGGGGSGGGLEPLFGHCVDGGATRVTITSAPARNGGVVWQVGGQVAERGVEMEAGELIRHVREELRAVLPGFAEAEAAGGLVWSTYRIDRAEGRRPDGSRPEGVALREEANVLTAWPTKLALAPVLADDVAERVSEDRAERHTAGDAGWPPDVLRAMRWPEPGVAQPPWEREQSWIADPSAAMDRR